MTSQIFRYGALALALTFSGPVFAQSNQPPSTEAPGNQPGKSEAAEGQSAMPMKMHHRRHHHHHHHMSQTDHGAGASPAAGGSPGPGDSGTK
jgi:hypothetical protein